MELIAHNNKEVSAQARLSSPLLKFLLFILSTSFYLTATSQCAGIIDNSTSDFCITAGSTKIFSNATASGGTINWISSGDGTFNNNTLVKPTYTPGPIDLATGYVFIYLDVYVDDEVSPCSVLPFVTLHFNTMKAVVTPAAQTVCSGTVTAPIISNGALVGSIYNWTRNNTATVTGIAASGTGNIVAGLNNNTSAPVTVTFAVTPVAAGCAGAPTNATVLVNPKPVAIATPASQTVCSGSTITPIALSSAVTGTTFNWTRDNSASITGIAASGSGNIAGALTNTTNAPVTVTFTITPTANGCAGAAITRTVTVNPGAKSTPITQTICSGTAITSIVSSSPIAGTTYSWTRNNTASVTGIAASGSGNIAGVLTNTTGLPVTVAFTIIPSSCTGGPITATVLVNPAPLTVATPSSQIICSGTTIIPIALSSNIGGTTYTWTRNNTASVTGISASGSGNISGTLTNTTAAPVTVTFTIATVSGCTSAPITATVIVNPTPVATATPLSQTICSGATVIPIALSSNVSGTTYSWTRNNTALVTGIAASGSGNITGILTNTGMSAVSVAFIITPTVNGCVGTPINATVLVNPVPVALATPLSQTICSGATITSIVLSSSMSGTTYSWTRNSTATVTGIAASGSGNITGTLTNPTTGPITVTFSITPTANGCIGTPVVATVLVNPTPSASATPSSQTICSGATITAIALSSGVSGTTYTWTRNNTALVTGIAASGSGNISGILTNTSTSPATVTFTITPTANGCAGAPVTATVLVNAGPIATATPLSQTICSGATISTIVLSSNVVGSTYSWTRNNTATITGIAASGSGNIAGALVNTTASAVSVTFTIIPTASGCVGAPISATVIVNPALVASATPLSQTMCSGSTITSIALSSNIGGTTYSWTRDNTATIPGIAASGSGNIAGALTNTTTAAITVTFTITPTANGCIGAPITATVLVNAGPIATATPLSQTICSGATISPIVLNSNVGGSTYSWTRNNTASVTGIAASGSGNISGSLTNTTAAAITVTFTVTPTVNGCIGAPITATVLVNAGPVASATPLAQTICSGGTLNPIILNSNVGGSTFSWTRDNTAAVTGLAASGSGNITGTLTNTTGAPVTVTFTITSTAAGCIGAPITATVLVNPAPAALATPSSQAICSGATINAIMLSSTTSGATYTWVRDNIASVSGIAASGSGNITGALTNITTSAVTVTFTITPTANGCTGAPITATVLVNKAPIVTATPLSQTICSGAIINTVLLSSNVTGTTYSWTRDNAVSVTGVAASGSGNIAGALINTTTAAVTVTFTITPTANGCTGTPITATVLVNAGPTASATPLTQTICSGGAINAIILSSNLAGTTYSWTRDNTAAVTGITASGSTNITGTLINTTTAPVTVTFTITPTANGCNGIPVIATVLVNPIPNVTATPLTQTICSGSAFAAILLNGTISLTTYNWTRDNTISVTGIAASGSGNISGAMTNNTAAAITVTFTITPTVGSCAGTPVTATVVVNPVINATATPLIQTICSGSTITSIVPGGGISGTTYNWTRDNSASVTGIPAAGAGNISGVLTNTTNAPVTVTFTITPMVGGCNGTPVIATVLVNPIPNAIAAPLSQTICSAAAITPIEVSGNVSGTIYNWTRDNTVSVTGIPASGSGNITGTLTNTSGIAVTITFTITPIANGCSGTPVSATVLVNPTTTASATPLTQTICSGSAMTPVVLSGAILGTVYNWTRDNTVSVTGIPESGSGDITGTLINTTSAPLTITFTVTPIANGCPGIPVTATVLVNPAPNVVATPLNQIICSAATITQITLSGSITGTIYNWTRDNAISVTGIAASGSGNITGALTNTTNAPVTVTFTVTPTVNGCTGTPVLATVLVNPRPNAIAAPVNQTLCSGIPMNPIILNGNVTGTIYNWSRNNAIVTGLPTSGSGNVSGTLANTSTTGRSVVFTFTPTANGCTGTAITASVLVNLRPTNALATPLSQTICSGSTITPIVSGGSSVGNTTYSWTRDNTGSVTGMAANGAGTINGTLINTTSAPVTVTFTITPIANACPGTPFTATVLVNPTPNAVATPLTQTICSGATINPMVLSGNVSGTTFNWTRDNTAFVPGIAANGAGDITGTLTNTTNAPVTVAFTITPTANGCAGAPITASVVVNPTPNAVATPSEQTICSGSTITSIIFSSNVSGTVYLWSRDNLATVTGADAEGSGDIHCALTNNTSSPVLVTFTIIPAINGCPGAPITATVLVNPTPVGAATPSSETVCSGTASTPIIPSSNIAGTSYAWTRDNISLVTGIEDAGSGDISCTLVNTTNVPQAVTFTITPMVTGCAGTPVAAVINVNPLPASVMSGTQSVCAGSTSSDISIALTGAAPWNFTYSDGITPVTVVGANTSPYAFTVPAPLSPVTYTVTSLNNAYCTAVPTDITGSATISPLNYAIIASAGKDGSITPNNATVLNCNASQLYTITPNQGFLIQDVFVDGLSQGPIATYPFTNVNASHTISATFVSQFIARNNIVADTAQNGDLLTVARPSVTPADQIAAIKNSFRVYPNPARSNAVLEFSSLASGTKFQVTISNAVGKTLFSKSGLTLTGKNTLQLDLGKFIKGFYLITLITDKNIQTQKLIKGQ